MHQKRGRLWTENGASESGKKKLLAELWHSLGNPANGSRSPPLQQPLAKLPTDRGHRCLEIWQFWRLGAKALADAVQLLRSGKP